MIDIKHVTIMATDRSDTFLKSQPRFYILDIGYNLDLNFFVSESFRILVKDDYRKEIDWLVANF